MKSIAVEDDSVCIFCGRPAEAKHHLIFGTAGRRLSDEDGLIVPVCNNCHNMGAMTSRIHGNPMAEKLSKMLGQALWERNQILREAVDLTEIVAFETSEDFEGYSYGKEKQRIKTKVRDAFRKRYGKSYF